MSLKNNKKMLALLLLVATIVTSESILSIKTNGA